MRTFSLLAILAPLVLAGCGAASAPARYTVFFRANAPFSRHVVPYPPDAVLRALPLAYADLELPVGPTGREPMEFSTPQLRVQGQLFGRRNAEFIECGPAGPGGSLEEQGEVLLAMLTRLEAAEGNATAVITQMDVYARRRDVASNPVACTSRGVVEEVVVAALLRRLRSDAP